MQKMSKTELERLVALETKMDTIITTVDKINTKIDEALPNIVTHAQFADYKEENTRAIAGLEKKFETVKLKNTITVWISGTLSAIFGAILAILIKAYLER